MQKLSGIRGLEGFRALVDSTSTTVKASNPKTSSDALARTYGNFTITAEKLVRGQVKTDLEMAHTKLRRETEQINLLEGVVQQAVNENAKLKVKQTEDSKLLQGLDSKVSSTKTLCDQLTETLQQLASQTERAEEDEKLLEEKLGKNSTDLDEFNCLLHDLSTKLECAEQTFLSEKLVKEQASVKTDLEMVHTKLRRATEQINLLEGKLQQAVNETAKLKVKQTEDSKLWQGLDLKVSSTKTLCDQLTETLQQLACQTERAEEDKKLLEEKLGKSSTALDEFNCLLHDLSTKLECAEQTILSAKQEMLQIKNEKEKMDRSYKEQLCANATTISENDSLIKQLEGSVDENKARLICLDSRLQCMEQVLKLKYDVCISLKENLASTENEKNNVQLTNQNYSLEIARLCKDNKDLNELLSSFVAKVTELDKEHASMSSHVSRLLCSFETFQGMVQEEKMLTARSTKDKFEDLKNQYVALTSENNGLKFEIEDLKSRIIELQKIQEIVTVQYVEECQVAEDKIRSLESEAETSASNIIRLEKIASELQGRIQKLLEDSSLAENHKQELLQKISKLESDNQELLGRVQTIMDEKSNNIESLQGEIAKCDQQVDAPENQVNKLCSVLDEKEELYSCSVEREKTLEEQKYQVEASLAATECQLSEAKKQYDLMLEDKQIELSKHLKELSLKNDQAINDIHKKYELEKIEIANSEKQKAEKLIKEMENKCNEKISENKKESEIYLMHLKEEHGTMVPRIQQDNEHKESTLRTYHKEELQRIQSQAENELKKRLSLLREEQELQIKSLRMQHNEEFQRLQEELELQKSKEEKQRALLQLLWKVMGENQQVDQEVNSKKESTRRFLHSTPAKNIRKKRKDPLNKPSKKKISNAATIILDPEDLVASCRSYRKGIRKAQAWCRAEGHYVDVSQLLGQGFEVITTPAGGTFHMTIEYRDQKRKEEDRIRRLTFYLHGRNLYLKGWRGGNGTFEIQSDKEKVDNYIQDPECKVLKTGINYNEMCKGGGVATVRTGPFAMMDDFDVLYKCDGVVSSSVVAAVAGFSVNLAEPIRNEDVLKKELDAFVNFHPDNLWLGSELAFWVRKYDTYSRKIMICVNCLLKGDPLPVVIDTRDESVISLQKLMSMYKVVLRDAFDEGEFKHQDEQEKPGQPARGVGPKSPVLCPVYSDAEDDDDTYPEDQEEETLEEEKENVLEEGPEKVQRKYQIRGSINRFALSACSNGMGCNGRLGLGAAACGESRIGYLWFPYRRFPAQLGMGKDVPVNSSLPWRRPNICIWRRMLRATRILRWRFL